MVARFQCNPDTGIYCLYSDMVLQDVLHPFLLEGNKILVQLLSFFNTMLLAITKIHLNSEYRELDRRKGRMCAENICSFQDTQ